MSRRTVGVGKNEFLLITNKVIREKKKKEIRKINDANPSISKTFVFK